MQPSYLFSSEVQSRGQGWDCNMSPFSKTQRSSGPGNSGTALQTSLSADLKEHDAPGEGLWTVFPEDSSASSSTNALSQENWNENGREERASSTLPALRRWEVGSRAAQVPSAPRHPSRLLSVLTERGAQASLPPPSPASLGEARSQPALAPRPGPLQSPGKDSP